MGRLEKLKPQIKLYKERSLSENGKVGEVVTFISLDDTDLVAARDRLEEYRSAGVDRVILGRPYESAEDWAPTFELLQKLRG